MAFYAYGSTKYKPSDAVTVSSIAVLHEEYGELVKELVIDHGTPYQLCKALRTTQAPPILISDCMAKQWFKKHGKLMKNQRMLASNGTLVPHVKGVRTYFGIVY